MKNEHRQLHTEISLAKQRYREKVENEFSCMNTGLCAFEKDVRSFGQIICPFNY